MPITYIQKTETIKKLFDSCSDKDSKYQKIIELGFALPLLDLIHKTPGNLVKGCQSTTYLHSYIKDGVVLFEASSDALISAGLAALLIHVYNGESPTVILKNPPEYLEELGITGSLTPNRANGLYSIHLRMKQDALTYLISP